MQLASIPFQTSLKESISLLTAHDPGEDKTNKSKLLFGQIGYENHKKGNSTVYKMSCYFSCSAEKEKLRCHLGAVKQLIM